MPLPGTRRCNGTAARSSRRRRAAEGWITCVPLPPMFAAGRAQGARAGAAAGPADPQAGAGVPRAARVLVAVAAIEVGAALALLPLEWEEYRRAHGELARYLATQFIGARSERVPSVVCGPLRPADPAARELLPAAGRVAFPAHAPGLRVAVAAGPPVARRGRGADYADDRVRLPVRDSGGVRSGVPVGVRSGVSTGVSANASRRAGAPHGSDQRGGSGAVSGWRARDRSPSPGQVTRSGRFSWSWTSRSRSWTWRPCWRWSWWRCEHTRRRPRRYVASPCSAAGSCCGWDRRRPTASSRRSRRVSGWRTTSGRRRWRWSSWVVFRG